jgi:DNA-binding MarR family transcriptional regulator
MSQETDRLISEILTRMTILRAVVNGDEARFHKTPVPEVEIALEPAPEPTMDDEQIRVLWATATFLGSGKIPTCTGMKETLDMSESHVGKQLQRLEVAGLVARRTAYGSVTSITDAGKELLQCLEPTPQWQR